MSQTSSPSLLYNVGLIKEITSGGDREIFLSAIPSNITRPISFSTSARFPKQDFTRSHSNLVTYISDQRILSSILHLLYTTTTNYSDTSLSKHQNTGSSRGIEITYNRRGADISTLLRKNADNSSQLLPFEIIRWIRMKTGLSQERVAHLVGVTRQTLYNWEKGEPILDHNRQRLLQVKDVLERAISQYPTPDALTTWLDTPRGVEGYTPAMLLERNEPGKARLFAMSNPSPHLKRAPSWVRRSIPEAFKSGEEHYAEALPPEYAEASTKLENGGDDDGGNSTIS